MKLIVLGGGSAGMIAAQQARELDAEVTLIESKRVGGTHINKGPAPERTLARAARLARDAGSWETFELKGARPQIDLAAVLANARRVANCAHEEKHLAEYLRSTGIELLERVGPAQSGSQFIQLEVREPEMAEDRSCKVCACFPARVSQLVRVACRKPKTRESGRWVEPFGQRRESHCDLVGGGFQPIERSIASSTERGVAGLTTKGLDLLSTTMLAISHECMDASISDAKELALLVRRVEALRVHALGGSPSAFHLRPGAYGCRGRSHHGRRRAVQPTDGAIVWAVRLEQTVERGAPSSSW